jgi:hypothetical protein
MGCVEFFGFPFQVCLEPFLLVVQHDCFLQTGFQVSDKLCVLSAFSCLFCVFFVKPADITSPFLMSSAFDFLLIAYLFILLVEIVSVFRYANLHLKHGGINSILTHVTA